MAPAWLQPGGGRRRRVAPGRRRLAVGLVAAALAALAGAVALAAGDGGGGGGDPFRAAPHPALRAATLERARLPARRGARRGSRVGYPAAAAAAGAAAPLVDRVLRRTPWVSGGTPRHRALALTFDDGPSPYTPGIVAALVRLRVPATFFVVGQQLRYFAGGLRDELRHGFLIGDHTVNHPELIRLGAPAQAAQIAGDARLLRRLGAPSPRLFRPPYGLANRITMSVLHHLRMLMVLWSVDPGDWRRPGVDSIVAGVLRAVRPGAIVILHDGGGDRSQTLAALPIIVRRLRRAHYDLVSLPRLLTLDPPTPLRRLPALTGA